MNLRRVTTTAVIALGLGMTVARAQPTEDEVHLLGRLGYGHDQWSLKRLRALGEKAYIDEQLDPGSIPDGELNRILRTDPAFDGLRMDLADLFTTFGPKDGQRQIGELTNQLQRELFLRAILSRRQLEAVLLEFWFNHFNVDAGGTEVNYLVPYLRDTLRPRILGKFEDLLLGVARSPAMLTYLDNAFNFRDGFVRDGKTRGLNENYARELLELHTLGIDDQGKAYDQQDVIEAARCLTGWSNRRQGDGFVFVTAGHDDGKKKVMGLKLAAGGGEQDGVELIRYLARHQRTKRFITGKLVRFFVGASSPALVDRAVQRWDATDGDLRAVVRTILVSPELRAAKGAKVRRPTMLLASALRAVEVDLSDAAERASVLSRLDQHCNKLGLDIHNIEPPTGWRDAAGTFVSEGSMIRRFNAFQALCAAGARFSSDFDPRQVNDSALVTALANRILGKDVLSATTRAAIEDYLGTLPASVDPAVRARTAMALVFSSPEFGSY